MFKWQKWQEKRSIFATFIATFAASGAAWDCYPVSLGELIRGLIRRKCQKCLLEALIRSTLLDLFPRFHLFFLMTKKASTAYGRVELNMCYWWQLLPGGYRRGLN